jgi:hypothetical protein
VRGLSHSQNENRIKERTRLTPGPFFLIAEEGRESVIELLVIGFLGIIVFIVWITAKLVSSPFADVNPSTVDFDEIKKIRAEVKRLKRKVARLKRANKVGPSNAIAPGEP